jgi:hypothetical protein
MAKTRRKPEEIGALQAAPQAVGDTTAASVDRERVAQRAYELYLSRGGSDGYDVDDWLSAERELGGGDRTAEGSSQRPDEV